MNQNNEVLVTHQVELENLFSKNQLIPRLRSEFMGCKELDFAAYFESKQIPVPFGFDVLVQMALHKRADLATMIGLLRHHFDDSQLTADMLLKAAQADLMDWSPTSRVFIVRFEISDDVQAELDRFQFPLPMVVEPKYVKNNKQSGYLLGSGSVILRQNHHDDDVCLDHINRMNKIKLTINLEVVKMVKNKWKNLDKPKECETREKFEQRKRAFEKYDRTAKDVLTLLMKCSTHFHLTHRYDKRGRTYSMGYHVNYQGNPWCKSVIEFADKEIVQ